MSAYKNNNKLEQQGNDEALVFRWCLRERYGGKRELENLILHLLELQVAACEG